MLILKLMVLLVLYDVRSQRELMATVSERLDWLWFLGFDLKLRGQYTKLMTSVRVQAHVINLVYCPRNSQAYDTVFNAVLFILIGWRLEHA